MPEGAISVQDAAKLAGVSRETIYAWVRKGVVREVPTPDARLMLDRADMEQVVKALAEGETLVVKPKHTERKLERRRKILELCWKNKYITVDEIAERLKVSDTTIYSAARHLRAEGLLDGSPETGWVVAAPEFAEQAPARPDPPPPVRTMPKHTKRKVQRREKLLDLCRKNPHIGIADLAARLKCTTATIYLDLEALREAGALSGSSKSGWTVSAPER